MANFEQTVKESFPYSKAIVDALYEAIINTHPIAIFGYEEGNKKGWSEYYLWNNESVSGINVARIATEATKTILIEEAYKIIKAWHDKYEELEESGIKSIAPSGEVRSDMPPPEDLKYWQEVARKKEGEKEKISQKQKEEVKKWEQAIFITPKANWQPKEVELSPDNRQALQKLAEEAKKDPDDFYRKAEEKVADLYKKALDPKEYSPEEIKIISQKVATDFTRRVVSLPAAIPEKLVIFDPAEAIAILAVSDKPDIAETFSQVFQAREEFNTISTTTLAPAFGPVVSILYPKIIKEEAAKNFEVAPEKKENSIFEMQMQHFEEMANVRYQLVKILSDKKVTLTDKEIDELVGTVTHFNEAMKYLGYSALGRYEGRSLDLAGSSSGDLVSMFDFVGGRFGLGLDLVTEGGQPLLKIGFKIGKDKIVPLGTFSGRIAEKFASFGAKKAAVKAGVSTSVKKSLTAAFTKTGTWLAAKTGIQALATAMGAAGGPITAFLAWLISTIASELLWRLGVWIKNHWREIGLVLMLWGLVARLPMLLALGTAIFIAAVGTGTVLSGAAVATTSFIGLISSIAVSIAGTIIAVILAIPVLVALILFIINSSAYMYPPGRDRYPADTPGEISSPYIGVDKTASPNKVDKITGTVDIAYVIKIAPKQGPITINEITNKYQVFSEGNPPLPTGPPDIFNSYINQTISGEITINYSIQLDEKYNDSIVSDTVTVKATTEDDKEDYATAVASVVIGNPPTGCYALVNEESWPSTYRDNLKNAILGLTSGHPVFVAKVCAKGEVQLSFLDSDMNVGPWGWYQGTNKISLYARGLRNQLDAEYILSHESGHLMAAYSMPSVYVAYRDYPNIDSEPSICTYVNAVSPDENFAEAIALYASEKPFSCLGGSFKAKYPVHWQFANDVVFQ